MGTEVLKYLGEDHKSGTLRQRTSKMKSNAAESTVNLQETTHSEMSSDDGCGRGDACMRGTGVREGVWYHMQKKGHDIGPLEERLGQCVR